MLKSTTTLTKRVRVSLALFTALAVLPLGSTLQSAEAKPKNGAPAYGYRAKASKEQKRQYKRDRKEQRRNERDNRRDDRYDDRYDDNRRDDRYDDRYDNNRYPDRIDDNRDNNRIDAGRILRDYFPIR